MRLKSRCAPAIALQGLGLLVLCLMASHQAPVADPRRHNLADFFYQFKVRTSGRPNSVWRVIQDATKVYAAPSTRAPERGVLAAGARIHVEQRIGEEWLQIGLQRYLHRDKALPDLAPLRGLRDYPDTFELFWQRFAPPSAP